MSNLKFQLVTDKNKIYLKGRFYESLNPLVKRGICIYIGSNTCTIESIKAAIDEIKTLFSNNQLPYIAECFPYPIKVLNA